MKRTKSAARPFNFPIGSTGDVPTIDRGTNPNARVLAITVNPLGSTPNRIAGYLGDVDIETPVAIGATFCAGGRIAITKLEITEEKPTADGRKTVIALVEATTPDMMAMRQQVAPAVLVLANDMHTRKERTLRLVKPTEKTPTFTYIIEIDVDAQQCAVIVRLELPSATIVPTTAGTEIVQSSATLIPGDDGKMWGIAYVIGDKVYLQGIHMVRRILTYASELGMPSVDPQVGIQVTDEHHHSIPVFPGITETSIELPLAARTVASAMVTPDGKAIIGFTKIDAGTFTVFDVTGPFTQTRGSKAQRIATQIPLEDGDVLALIMQNEQPVVMTVVYNTEGATITFAKGNMTTYVNVPTETTTADETADAELETAGTRD